MFLFDICSYFLSFYLYFLSFSVCSGHFSSTHRHVSLLKKLIVIASSLSEKLVVDYTVGKVVLWLYIDYSVKDSKIHNSINTSRASQRPWQLLKIGPLHTRAQPHMHSICKHPHTHTYVHVQCMHTCRASCTGRNVHTYTHPTATRAARSQPLMQTWDNISFL